MRRKTSDSLYIFYYILHQDESKAIQAVASHSICIAVENNSIHWGGGISLSRHERSIKVFSFPLIRSIHENPNNQHTSPPGIGYTLLPLLLMMQNTLNLFLRLLHQPLLMPLIVAMHIPLSASPNMEFIIIAHSLSSLRDNVCVAGNLALCGF